MAIKITFLGAGSSVFVRNVLGDCIIHPELEDLTFALYDIDAQRLEDSYLMLHAICAHYGKSVKMEKYVGVEELPQALTGANFLICAIQVGGYDPCTISDFEIPKKYGLRQTIADTLGVGGVFRALRTIPVMEMFGRWLKNTARMQYSLIIQSYGYVKRLYGRYCNVQFVGLCHSVQVAVPKLFAGLGMEYDSRVQWKIAGINHMAWLLEVSKTE